MRYLIDIDNTITKTVGTDYENAEPIVERIERFNYLFNLGNEIIYFTARGSKTGINYSELTKRQLKKWGVKYNELIMNKPWADIIIDDKAINSESYFAIKWY
jgi:hypothetical protein